MRRSRAGFRSSKLVNIPEGEQGFWPSYADMMSSFALILFFLMLIAYLQNLITGNELISTEEKLKATEDTLAATILQVEDAKQELSNITLDLDEAKLAILTQQEQMAVYASTIEGQTATITEQETRIASQNEYIALTTEELTKLRQQMQTIAVLRLSILRQIKDNIAATLGDESKVQIGDNGSIILSDGLFFDYNSAAIKTGSHALLDVLTRAFTAFLSDGENAKYVDSIVISGHTDNSGAATRNRALSTERANAVLNYLLEENNGALKPYESFFCAAGYGATRPVMDNTTAAGRSANRRIEVSIILKDESVMKIVDAYLEQEMPDMSAAPTPTPTPAVSPTPGLPAKGGNNP